MVNQVSLSPVSRGEKVRATGIGTGDPSYIGY